MAGASKIEWTDATWNPIVGCSIVSPGCTNCYAMKEAYRFGFNKALPHYAGLTKRINYAASKKGKSFWTGKVALAPDHILTQPLRWRRGRKIFVNSMGDLFHESIPDEWIDKVFAVMALCPQHPFQVLTKRADRMRAYCSSDATLGRVLSLTNSWLRGGGNIEVQHHPDGLGGIILPNVWLGVSTERQQEADERIPELLKTPAAVRFISAEPLLDPIDLRRVDPIPGGHCNALSSSVGPNLDWVIVGGESGSNARPMHPQWARDLREQCAAADVPFFFKQWGQFAPFAEDDCKWLAEHPADDPDFDKKRGIVEIDRGQFMMRMQRKSAGRLLDGKEHNEFPEART